MAEIRAAEAGIVCGPNDGTLRDRDVPFRWEGLTEDDRDLLERLLPELGERFLELHTAVPVGSVPDVRGLGGERDLGGLVAALYPRRIDAALLFAQGWVLLEMKSGARSAAVGQLLGYVWSWLVDCPDRALAGAWLVTDVADPEVPLWAPIAGVRVIQLGHRGERAETLERGVQ